MENLQIRKACARDAETLIELYHQHLTKMPPEGEPDIPLWRDKLARFEKDSLYHLLVGVVEGKIVSSVTLVVIENLTHGVRPYAVMENVVTHPDGRGRGYATALIAHAAGIAKEMGCYKIMLLTGSKQESTLRFYERCGFDRYAKTAFLMRL
ncbi:MAG: GNAT family N-acetyltransferase [Clostridiaceae bacterium]|nr:GNAT family N-acetyltransferase [Clostridiaceae bacterium]